MEYNRSPSRAYSEWKEKDVRPVLYVGNKNYSSWSLRAGLCMAWSGIDYEEAAIELGQPGYGEGRVADALAVSPTGKVPALAVGDLALWDSLAIAEWAAETPGASLWPTERAVRAEARAATAEMHSGFPEIRTHLPMNLHGRFEGPKQIPRLEAEIRRVEELWGDCLRRFGGPWLFGERSIADAFYLPVASRFRTYGVELDESSAAYVQFVLEDADFLHWQETSEPNSWDASAADGLPRLDGLYPRRED